MEADSSKLVAAIRAFCLMVDYLESYSPLKWLREMYHLLPQIEAGMECLELKPESRFFVLPDLDWRFAMFCRLRAFLGEWEAYPLIGDCQNDPNDFTGSLADDFTDLYFELSRGLKLYDAEQDLTSALTLWYTGYVLHWNTHLTDARKQLEKLAQRKRW